MIKAHGYCGLPFEFPRIELDVENRLVPISRAYPDVYARLLGKVSLQPDGTWRCLADVYGALCLIEVTLTFQEVPADAQNEDQAPAVA